MNKLAKEVNSNSLEVKIYRYVSTSANFCKSLKKKRGGRNHPLIKSECLSFQAFKASIKQIRQ